MKWISSAVIFSDIGIIVVSSFVIYIFGVSFLLLCVCDLSLVLLVASKVVLQVQLFCQAA